MDSLTRFAEHLIALAAGIGMLILARDEPFLFRTGLACAAVVFTSGLIAIANQNIVGAGLVLAPMFIMLLVTSLLPRRDPMIEGDAETDTRHTDPARDPVQTRSASVPVHPLLRLSMYAVLALVLAFAAEAVHRGTFPRAVGERMRQLAAAPLSPYHTVADLSDTIALRALTRSDARAGRDDAADGSVGDILEASVGIAAPAADLDLEPKADRECLSPSGPDAAGAACDAADPGR